MASVAIIGSGFAGLSSAAYLSQKGYKVDVFEKNATPGGRARSFSSNGYLFDMGPSWYWMPDVFEKFFNDFDQSVSHFYDLQLLDPAFEMVFENEIIAVPADFSSLCDLFESIEKGSSDKLNAFMKEAQLKYDIGVGNLVYKPSISPLEFADPSILKNIFKLQVFSSFSKHISHYFSDHRLKALMEFPVLFLGAMPEQTPALYSLMNYAGLKLGTWYPKGGFGKIVEAMVAICKEHGVTLHFNAAVEKITVENNKACGVIIDGNGLNYDAVVAAADYEHIENKLLPAECRNYTDAYCSKRTFAPSSLIYYVGINKKIPSLKHHTLFFEESLFDHSVEIYQQPKWPTKPLFYVCCPSKSDDSVAPAGHENLFLLMPIAPGLEDSESTREQYFLQMVSRLERFTGETNLISHIDHKKSYCVSDFISDYNSYKGNAYGLANTLMQTAFLKPKMKNKKVCNLFYAGQLTVPGPGVPPALISGKIAAQQVHKLLKRQLNEIVV